MSQLILPTMFQIRNQMIPGRLTLKQRETFARGIGVPRPQAAVFAMQDRAASLAAVLGTLLERAGRPDLLASANLAITRWNTEVDEFLGTQA